MRTLSKESFGSDSDPPRVTVVIPCYNQVNFLDWSLGSVFSQTYENLNVIAVNDGSTDGSHEKLMSWQDKSEGKMTVLSNDSPQGPSAARNKAFRYVLSNDDDDTSFFSMLDSDDKYAPNKVEISVKKIMEDPICIGHVYSDVKIVDWNSDSIEHELREPYSRQVLEQYCMVSNTPLISALALKTVGLYDEDMRTAEDWDLWLRITEKFLAVHVPEAISFYSVTGNNASDTVSKDIWNENWQKIRERISEQHGN